MGGLCTGNRDITLEGSNNEKTEHSNSLNQPQKELIHDHSNNHSDREDEKTNKNKTSKMAVNPNNNNNNNDKKIPLLSGNIDESRYNIYKAHMIKYLQNGDKKEIKLLSVKSVTPDTNNDEKDEIIEKIIASYSTSDDNNNSNSKEIEFECRICMDDEFTPSQLIEYRFGDNNENSDKWYLAEMCLDCLSVYRKTKFEYWQHMIENPTCEAAFRRLLKIGVITHMFDSVAFPTPNNEKHLYTVKDHHGKPVTIPHPVSDMRIWDASKGEYSKVKAHLDGAPSTDDEIKIFWNEMLEKFYKKHGKDVVIEWLNATADES